MRTLKEAAEMQGVTETEFGLSLHFSPIRNWYMPTGTDCPCCDNPIWWDWDWGKNTIPQITTDNTPTIVKPIISGASLIDFGHRWISMQCDKCHTQLLTENFD